MPLLTPDTERGAPIADPTICPDTCLRRGAAGVRIDDRHRRSAGGDQCSRGRRQGPTGHRRHPFRKGCAGRPQHHVLEGGSADAIGTPRRAPGRRARQLPAVRGAATRRRCPIHCDAAGSGNGTGPGQRDRLDLPDRWGRRDCRERPARPVPRVAWVRKACKGLRGRGVSRAAAARPGPAGTAGGLSVVAANEAVLGTVVSASARLARRWSARLEEGVWVGIPGDGRWGGGH